MALENIAGLHWLNNNARYRCMVFLRIIAAFIGGYVLTSYITAVTAQLLPLAKAEAVVLSALLSFLWFLIIIIWAFAVKSLLKVWLVIGLLTALFAAIHYLIPSVVVS